MMSGVGTCWVMNSGSALCDSLYVRMMAPMAEYQSCQCCQDTAALVLVS